MNIKSHIDSAQVSIDYARKFVNEPLGEGSRTYSLLSIAESLLGIAKLLNEIEGNGYLRVRDEGGAV